MGGSRGEGNVPALAGGWEARRRAVAAGGNRWESTTTLILPGPAPGERVPITKKEEKTRVTDGDRERQNRAFYPPLPRGKTGVGAA